MNVKILKLIEKDAKMSISDIAAVTGLSAAEVEAEILEMDYLEVVELTSQNAKRLLKL